MTPVFSVWSTGVAEDRSGLQHPLKPRPLRAAHDQLCMQLPICYP